MKQKLPLEECLQLGVKLVAFLGSAQFRGVQVSNHVLSCFSGTLITYSSPTQGRSVKQRPLCAEGLTSQDKVNEMWLQLCRYVHSLTGYTKLNYTEVSQY